MWQQIKLLSICSWFQNWAHLDPKSTFYFLGVPDPSCKCAQSGVLPVHCKPRHTLSRQTMPVLSESDRDSGMCDCSSLKSIMQTLDLIYCFQCVIYTLWGIWGLMYGHVCETGSTREVLPPRSLKRFTIKVCLNLKIDLRSGQKYTTATRSRTPSGAREYFKETYAAQDCAVGWRFYMCASGDIYLWFK